MPRVTSGGPGLPNFADREVAWSVFHRFDEKVHRRYGVRARNSTAKMFLDFHKQKRVDSLPSAGRANPFVTNVKIDNDDNSSTTGERLLNDNEIQVK